MLLKIAVIWYSISRRMSVTMRFWTAIRCCTRLSCLGMPRTISALAMNSQAETVLNDIGGTLFKSGGETPAQLSSYNGRSIIVDDGVPL